MATLASPAPSLRWSVSRESATSTCPSAGSSETCQLKTSPVCRGSVRLVSGGSVGGATPPPPSHPSPSSCNLTGGFPQLYSTLTWLTVLRIDGNQLVGSREAGITLRKTLGNTSMCCEPQRSRPAPLERPPPGPPEIIPPPETAEMMLVARAMNYKRRTTSEEMDRLGVSKILS